MFDSGMTVSDLIVAVNNEIDVAITVDNSSYVRWINVAEQMLYGEIIKERKAVILAEPTSPIALTEIVPSAGELQMIFEDIATVYADGVELKKSTLGDNIFPDTYCKADNKLSVNRADILELKVIYSVRPALKTVGNIATDKIMLPYEFLELMTSKLRGEAYKLANENTIAANWLNDYNVLVENFKIWVENKAARFGV